MRLPSALRPKRRYVAFLLHCDGRKSRDEVIRALWKEVLNFLGEQRASGLNLWLMDFDAGPGRGFLRVAHDRVGVLKGCLALIGEVGGSAACIEVLGVSGTIAALKKKFLADGIPPGEDVEREMELYGSKMRLVRSSGDCVYAVPSDRELLSRLEREGLAYVGLTKEDLKGQV